MTNYPFGRYKRVVRADRPNGRHPVAVPVVVVPAEPEPAETSRPVVVAITVLAAAVFFAGLAALALVLLISTLG